MMKVRIKLTFDGGIINKIRESLEKENESPTIGCLSHRTKDICIRIVHTRVH
jgi:hypothetical protein